ncbi:MAG: helix-turn-helix domain-containing protein [Deltaproteobacteria bacterium]|nr:helix-turn-helix domain-containing protein [Deltaproteobacteria bacterium]
MKQTAFGERLGFSRTATISDYEKDKRCPDIETLRKIAALGSVKLEWLLTGDGPESVEDVLTSTEAKDAGAAPYGEEFVEVNVFDTVGSEKLTDFPASAPIDIIHVRRSDFTKACLAVKVRGDSMSPAVVDGAIVGIGTTDADKRLVSGCLYAVWLSYEGVTVKRVFVLPGKVVLKPDNPAFPETSIPASNTGEDFIVGRVAWVYQRYD